MVVTVYPSIVEGIVIAQLKLDPKVVAPPGPKSPIVALPPLKV